MIAEERLDRIAEVGYDFNIGDYFKDGWNIFKEYAGGFIGYTLACFFIIMLIALIPIVGGLVLLFVGPALITGIFIVADKVNNRETTRFEDFFNGFDHFLHTGLAYLSTQIIAGLAVTPFILAAAIPLIRMVITDGEPNILEYLMNFPTWSFLLLIPAIYLSVALSWSILFVVHYDMDFWKAIIYSEKIIRKNWIMIFLFYILVSVMCGAGALFMGLGLLITVPLAYCMVYAAFADVTQLDDDVLYKTADDMIV